MPKWFKIGVQAYTYRNHMGQNPDKILQTVETPLKRVFRLTSEHKSVEFFSKLRPSFLYFVRTKWIFD